MKIKKTNVLSYSVGICIFSAFTNIILSSSSLGSNIEDICKTQASNDCGALKNGCLDITRKEVKTYLDAYSNCTSQSKAISQDNMTPEDTIKLLEATCEALFDACNKLRTVCNSSQKSAPVNKDSSRSFIDSSGSHYNPETSQKPNQGLKGSFIE